MCLVTQLVVVCGTEPVEVLWVPLHESLTERPGRPAALQVSEYWFMSVSEEESVRVDVAV